MNTEELVDNFSLFDDWEERYRYLIDLGRELEAFPEEMQTDDRLVKGCTSAVWMEINFDSEGRFIIQADSNAHIVRGLIALLIKIYSGKTLEEIKVIKIEDIFGRIGLDQHLSPSRRNGFFSMVERIQEFAAQ